MSSFCSYNRLAPQAGVTNILFVLPPLNSLGAERLLQDVLSTLSHADAFRFRAAVLEPNGTSTPFTEDLAALQRNFKAAAQQRA